MQLTAEEARDLHAYLEVELAATRIALKKARKSFLKRWQCGRLHRQEVEYEKAIAELRRNTQFKGFKC